MNIALLIAGGSGARMHQNIPKQFLTVNERPVIVYTLEAFQHHPEIDEIAVVCIEGWESVLWAYANQFNITKLKYVVPGGKNGQDSIRNGVFELEKHHSPDDIVLIHDAIRPMVSAEIISDCIRVTQLHGNGSTHIEGLQKFVVEKGLDVGFENVRVTDKKAAQNDHAVQEAVSKVAEALGDTGRILVRESGTEPVVRVMVEAPDHDTCQKYVDEVVNVICEKGYKA